MAHWWHTFWLQINTKAHFFNDFFREFPARPKGLLGALRMVSQLTW